MVCIPVMYCHLALTFIGGGKSPFLSNILALIFVGGGKSPFKVISWASFLLVEESLLL
jgi:hypothetical protein